MHQLGVFTDRVGVAKLRRSFEVNKGYVLDFEKTVISFNIYEARRLLWWFLEYLNRDIAWKNDNQFIIRQNSNQWLEINEEGSLILHNGKQISSSFGLPLNIHLSVMANELAECLGVDLWSHAFQLTPLVKEMT